MIMPFSERLRKLSKLLRDLDGFLVTDLNNVSYLTGFTGSSGFVLTTREQCIFATDFRYKEQAEREVAGCRIIIEKKNRVAEIKRMCKELGINKLGVEDSLPIVFYGALNRFVSEITPVSGRVQKMRSIKTSDEAILIRKAVKRAEEAFQDVRPYIKAGQKERSIALRLEERLKKRGCRRLPFDIIIASGDNSAMPHAIASDKKIEAGDLVVIDWGGEAGGYYSDMTRTLLIRGKGIGKKKEIYSLVLQANRKGRAAVAPGVGSKDIDNTAREIIRKAGYGEYFGHGLGHGVGLEIHEMPRISRWGNVSLKKGMVFTIEPGVYVPELGGVRIEDMVIVGSSGAESLTSLSRKLEII
jgi:Xaa-Pro aminopeptidase